MRVLEMALTSGYLPKTLEEEIAHCKRRIVEFEKFTGPIATDMVQHLKHRIDCLRAVSTPLRTDVSQEENPRLH